MATHTCMLLVSCALACGSALRVPTIRAPRAAATTMQMPEAATQLLLYLGRAPEEISFTLTMEAIGELYEVSEVPFSVGDVVSEPGQNMGSAKIFSFAQLSKLDEKGTLQLFGVRLRQWRKNSSLCCHGR